MKPTISQHDSHPLSLTKYIVGFVGCVALTMAAYLLVTRSTLSTGPIVAILALLAIAQFIVQMVLFLHVGEEHGPRWKLAVMCLMLSVVLILVGGSIWIMNNLNYRMTPQQVQQYLKSQDSL
ncbi:MAG TPA: cytochrome o ubiquinol oxidase subunit IV [Candidatus Saccharimonadales bacterium]|nr:cytochrome o ubiquinol oxidase subunit IV [Candidatus Saccharimonadales bacterium]